MPDPLHAAALRLLAARALSEWELAERLQRRGFTATEVGRELARLRQEGLLDDLGVARATCADLLRRGYGRTRLAAALSRRGVPKETVRRALAEVSDEDELLACRRALQRFARGGACGGALPLERARVVRYLLARGFPAGLVARAVGGDEDNDDLPTSSFDEGDPPGVS